MTAPANPFALPEQQNPTPAPATPVAPAQPAPAVTPAQPATPAAAPAGGDDPFSGPAPQAARSPRFRELYGRLILLIPKKLETGLVSSTFKNPDGSAVVQDRMTADLIVLDGGTIHYGGEPEKIPPRPHDKTAEPPERWPDGYISFTGIISQCRDALAKRLQGQPGMVLGRLAKGADSGKGNPPWLLTPPTEQDKQVARQYLASVDPFA